MSFFGSRGMREGVMERDPSNEWIEATNLKLFKVEPKFEATAEWAQFNVETVNALDDGRDGKPELRPAAEVRAALLGLTKQFYAGGGDDAPAFFGRGDLLIPPRLEAASHLASIEPPSARADARGLVEVRADGFVGAVVGAFARHRPLILSPDDFWQCISFAFAKHVEAHAEELRDRFVAHAGKKALHVECDDFALGATPPEQWEARAISGFSAQIRAHIGAATHDAVAAPFSTTGPVEAAAAQVTLMAAMKKYFSYSMSTMCGVPWVKLEGTARDWDQLVGRAAALRALVLPAFADAWLSRLLPVLELVAASRRGEVDHLFWQNMVKVRQHGFGSGAHESISGWIALLFPYLQGGELSPHLRPWREMTAGHGPRPEEFPSVLSSAPVEWDYNGATQHLHFHAGFVGVAVDAPTRALRPAIGWAITHDPPSSPAGQRDFLESELAELVAGHAPQGVDPSALVARLLEADEPLTPKAVAGILAPGGDAPPRGVFHQHGPSRIARIQRGILALRKANVGGAAPGP